MALTVARIIDAGMTVFAAVGYERMSMRLVADALGVQVGSLYYHVRNKAVLLALMADNVAQEAFDAGGSALAQLPPDAGDRDRLVAQLKALRQTLRRRPGAARLLPASPRTLGDGPLALMERLLRMLTTGGLPLARAVILADVLLSYVTGFVLQEEAEAITMPDGSIVAADQLARFPLTAAAVGTYDDDEMFTRGIELLCGHAIPVEDRLTSWRGLS